MVGSTSRVLCLCCAQYDLGLLVVQYFAPRLDLGWSAIPISKGVIDPEILPTTAIMTLLVVLLPGMPVLGLSPSGISTAHLLVLRCLGCGIRGDRNVDFSDIK
ncbi:MAG: hypothetical protein ACYDHP_10170 [Ferrimicrobium sp.]